MVPAKQRVTSPPSVDVNLNLLAVPLPEKPRVFSGVLGHIRAKGPGEDVPKEHGLIPGGFGREVEPECHGGNEKRGAREHPRPRGWKRDAGRVGSSARDVGEARTRVDITARVEAIAACGESLIWLRRV